MKGVAKQQRAVCERIGAEFVAAPKGSMIGVSKNIQARVSPLNGLRHPPEGQATGWFIWRGEALSSDPDFFAPMHVAHIREVCPRVLGYLGLAPGWRFLLAPKGYEDVWFDSSLLDI